MIHDFTTGSAGFIYRSQALHIESFEKSIQLLQYDQSAYGDDLYKHFTIDEPGTLSTWFPSRRAQFLAGRLAAKQALESSQCFESAEQVPIGKHREPIWPSSLIGSISHSEPYSIAAVQPQTDTFSGLGLDIQSLVASDTQHQISATILTKQDESLLTQGFSNLSESQLFTIIFSAKESFFKAVFNTVGDYFDFDAVSAVDINSSKLTLKTEKSLGKVIPEGLSVTVAFVVCNLPDTRIISLCDWEL